MFRRKQCLVGRGFSLLEVVAACSALVALVGVLIVVGIRNRGGSAKTKCKDNLAKIGLACMMYSDSGGT